MLFRSIKAKWDKYEAGTASGSTGNEVLLKTVNRSQGETYNNVCPLYQSERTQTGCVATSMAIIMKYHCWPERAIGSGSYYRPGGSNVLNLVNFGSEYNWDLMLDYYYTDYYGNPEYTEDQAKAIATLMLHCGASVHMNYNISGSAARTSDCVTAFKNNFSYSEDVESLAFEESDPNTWMAIIKNNINNNRPIIYSGNSEDVGGHAFLRFSWSIQRPLNQALL